VVLFKWSKNIFGILKNFGGAEKIEENPQVLYYKSPKLKIKQGDMRV